MSKSASVALGIAVLVLFGALAIPAAIDASQGTTLETASISEGEHEEFGTSLQVAVDDVSGGDVIITATNLKDGETITKTIPAGNTTAFNFDFRDATVFVTIDSVNPPNTIATLTVEYPSTFGYNRSALVVQQNLPIILVTMLFISIMGFVGVRI